MYYKISNSEPRNNSAKWTISLSSSYPREVEEWLTNNDIINWLSNNLIEKSIIYSWTSSMEGKVGELRFVVYLLYVADVEKFKNTWLK